MKNLNKLLVAEFLLLIFLNVNQISLASADSQYAAGSIAISWAEHNATATEFIITSNSASKGSYFAFGLSKDDEMV